MIKNQLKQHPLLSNFIPDRAFNYQNYWEFKNAGILEEFRSAQKNELGFLGG